MTEWVSERTSNKTHLNAYLLCSNRDTRKNQIFSFRATHLPLPPPLFTDTLVGTVITQVTGNDVDSGPALSYTLLLAADCQGAFGIRRYSGGVSLTAPLDYEERSWFTLTVRTSDSRHQSEANLTVLVEDVNDNAPLFTQDLYQVKNSVVYLVYC